MPSLDSCAPTEVQDSCIAESQKSLSTEVLQGIGSELQRVFAQEQARVLESVKNFLPDFGLTFGADPAEPGAAGKQAANAKSSGDSAGGDRPRTSSPIPVESSRGASSDSANAEKRPDGGVARNTLLPAEGAQGVFERNFDRLDTDKDGFIDESEINSAMANRQFKGEDAALVAMLKGRRAELEELSDDEWGDENDGISRADMSRFNEIAGSKNRSEAERDLVNNVNGELYRSYLSIDGTNRELFANSEKPLESIKPEAVQQGLIGDCYFLAAVGAVASSPEGRQAIKDMISKNGDGTYTVTFPGDREHPVTIDAPTDAELARYAAGSEHGTWVAVLEKAYGRYSDANNVDAHDGIANGAIFARGLSILTGRSIDTDSISLTSSEDTHRKLSEAIAAGRPVTAGINNELGSLVGLSDNLSDEAGLPGGHLYSVTGYDADTRTVTVRNPWGRGEPVDANGNAKDGKDDGTFRMSLTEFERNFSRVSYVQGQ